MAEVEFTVMIRALKRGDASRLAKRIRAAAEVEFETYTMRRGATMGLLVGKNKWKPERPTQPVTATEKE